jgi:hypothetical protein
VLSVTQSINTYLYIIIIKSSQNKYSCPCLPLVILHPAATWKFAVLVKVLLVLEQISHSFFNKGQNVNKISKRGNKLHYSFTLQNPQNKPFVFDGHVPKTRFKDATWSTLVISALPKSSTTNQILHTLLSIYPLIWTGQIFLQAASKFVECLFCYESST